MPENFPKIITIKIAKSINSIDRSLMVWTDIFDKRVLIDINQIFYPTYVLWLCKTGIHANVNVVAIGSKFTAHKPNS